MPTGKRPCIQGLKHSGPQFWAALLNTLWNDSPSGGLKSPRKNPLTNSVPQQSGSRSLAKDGSHIPLVFREMWGTTTLSL
jgi:hypothetical protein